MITRYRAALDGKQLDAVAPGIIIADISYAAPAVQSVSSALAAKSGMHEQARTYGTSSVTISFEIHEAKPHVRQEVCQKVQGWAMAGGAMTTSDRPGQRLHVKCSVLPAIDSALRWTQKIQMMFTAQEKPFWEDITPTRVSVTPDAGKTMYVLGTAEQAMVSVSVKNTGADTVDILAVYAGDTFMEFAGLGLEAGSTLEIGDDDQGLLFITSGGVSKMDKRTAESSDELYVKSGVKSNMRIVADGSVSAVFTARGQYV